MAELTGAQSRLIDEAGAASAGSARLSDIQHVVILMQENRSFDHYFGTLSGVRADLPAAAGGITGPVGFRVPALPPTSLGPTSLAEQAVLNSLADTLDLGINYPLPTSNAMPSQETSPKRPPVPQGVSGFHPAPGRRTTIPARVRRPEDPMAGQPGGPHRTN